MKAPKNRLTFFLVLASILLPSCSPLSENVRQETEAGIAFESLKQNPEGYIGKRVVLGGHILEIRNLPKITEVTVLQTPLDFQDRPKAKEQSQGRFVTVYDGFLDPAIYEKGRIITVAGIVLGREIVQVDGYAYPTLAIKPVETHLWEKEERSRPYPYYDPFYDHYFYDPFYPWPRPYPLYRRPWSRRR